MSKQRRSKSLYSEIKTNAITPDLSRQQQIIIKVVPDTKTERTLYRMLLAEMRENERLRKALSIARERLIHWQARGMVKRVASGFKASHNPSKG